MMRQASLVLVRWLRRRQPLRGKHLSQVLGRARGFDLACQNVSRGIRSSNVTNLLPGPFP